MLLEREIAMARPAQIRRVIEFLNAAASLCEGDLNAVLKPRGSRGTPVEVEWLENYLKDTFLSFAEQRMDGVSYLDPRRGALGRKRFYGPHDL